MSADEAREAERTARLAVQAIEAGARAAGEEAKRGAVQAYYEQHDYDGARARLREAVTARLAAQDALPDHPWEGKRVFRVENTDRRRALQHKRVEGIVETYRSHSKLPGNAGSWRIPDIGEAIVRHLKKDGSPALKFEKLNRGYGDPWQLVDAQTPPEAS